MKDLHAIAQERQLVEGEIKSLRTQIANGEQALADKRARLEAELTKLAALKDAALAVFDRTERAGLEAPEEPDFTNLDALREAGEQRLSDAFDRATDPQSNPNGFGGF